MSLGVGVGDPARVSTQSGTGAARKPAPDPAELAPSFPQLEILEPLGQGGMGAVYRARQKGLDRFVALKILTVAEEAGQGFAERFAREAKALASLNHANIVTVYDFGEAGGHFYLLMEFIEGENLRETIRAGKIAPHTALAIVSQVCEALQFAHDHGIVHRDIKPENILIDTAGRVKIADFGLAKILRFAPEALELTDSRQAMGTVHYMAPEQVERPREVDHRADIFSLGVVFYELLTGELPLGRFDPPSRRLRLDVRIDDVVLKTLEKEPGRRYQHASEVKTEVDSITDAPPRNGKKEAASTTLITDADAGISAGQLRVAGWACIADAVLALPMVAIGFALYFLSDSLLARIALALISVPSTALFLFIAWRLYAMLNERFRFSGLNAIIVFLMATHVVWLLTGMLGALLLKTDAVALGVGLNVVVELLMGLGYIVFGALLLSFHDPAEPLWKPLAITAISMGVLMATVLLTTFGLIPYVIFNALLATIFFRVAERVER